MLLCTIKASKEYLEEGRELGKVVQRWDVTNLLLGF